MYHFDNTDFDINETYTTIISFIYENYNKISLASYIKNINIFYTDENCDIKKRVDNNPGIFFDLDKFIEIIYYKFKLYLKSIYYNNQLENISINDYANHINLCIKINNALKNIVNDNIKLNDINYNNYQL